MSYDDNIKSTTKARKRRERLALGIMVGVAVVLVGVGVASAKTVTIYYGDAVEQGPGVWLLTITDAKGEEVRQHLFETYNDAEVFAHKWARENDGKLKWGERPTIEQVEK